MENETGIEISDVCTLISKNKSRGSDNVENLENVEGIDPSCIYNPLKNKLVRIQYPGIVKNLDKALDTLGGLSGIEKAVSNQPNKLQLNFHPANKYNKGCVADCDSKSGLLLKVKVETSCDGTSKYSYEVIGITVRNFIFNKLIDFQYLPLVAPYPETSDSDTDYIYESILPKKLPSLQDMLKEDKANMALFLPPAGFSRSDVPRKLSAVKKQPIDNIESGYKSATKNPKKQCMAFVKQDRTSIFHKFLDPEVPQRPTEIVTQVVAKRNYQDALNKLRTFFEERPIWTKNGIKCNTNFSNDVLKILLPALAYYEITGPWRCTWIRFGYDPRKDPEARKFQNLDYRIPNPIRSNLRIGSKRCVLTSDRSGLGSLKKLPSEDKQSRCINEENSYILRPNMLPPTRQVFYQYCDILLPEIQTMLARLPQVPSGTQCDSKNGWFPTSFVDQCREIVNKYIDQQASTELLKRGQDPLSVFSVKVEKEPKSTDYCSLMIKNVKRGLYREGNPLNVKTEAGPSTSYEAFETASITEIVDSDSESEESVDDESFYQDNDPEEFVDQWEEPRETTDGDMLINTNQESMDIDTDALEDVKYIIANTHIP